VAEAVRELRVFLASPGDVDAERAAVREVADRINANFEERGVRVRITGWERVRTELGRPQELINPHVYKCDVFIALLNRRWGSDSGIYSSGFEEEFEVALERRQDGGTPAIGMFFAELQAEALADPGRQLEKVIAFQDRVRTDKLGLYKQYGSTDHLATEVLDFLTGHALELAAQTEEGSGDLGAGASPSSPYGGLDRQRSASTTPQIVDEVAQAGDDIVEGSKQEADDAGRQIACALRAFASSFDAPIGDLGTSAVRDRVTLVGTAFALDDKLLGTHHVNRLYKRRDDLRLTNGEWWTWLRTYFADRHADRATRTIPIWGLFHPRDTDTADIHDDLMMMATHDDRRVARGALAFMTEHRVRPPRLWATPPEDEAQRGAALDETTSQGDAPAADLRGESNDAKDVVVRAATDVAVSSWVSILEQLPGVGVAANYLIAVATEADLDLLEALAAAEELDESSRQVVNAIVESLRGDARILATMAPSRYVEDTDALVDHIHHRIPELGETEWEALLKSRNLKLAVPAALELVGLGGFTEKRILALLKLNEAEVDAALAAQALDDSDLLAILVSLLQDSQKGLDEREQRTARLMAAAVPLQAIRELVDMERSYRLAAWEALTIQDPQGMAEQAREVLDDRSEFFNAKVADLREDYPALAENVFAEGRRAACTLLSNPALQATNEEREFDLARVIDELRRDDFRTHQEALSAIAALVDEATVDRVPLAVVDGYWVTDHVDELLSGPLAAALSSQWRTSSVSDLRTAAARWYIEQPKRTDEELEAATYDDDMSVRMTAIDLILTRWNRDQVLALLKRYDEQDRPWWYNVIAAIDEHLYGFETVKPRKAPPLNPGEDETQAGQ
jgi:hypothetical protein